MSDSAYQNALATKDRLIKELEEVETFLKQYERFAGRALGGAVPPRVETEQTGNNKSLVSPPQPMSDRKKNSVPERFKPLIRKVLLANNRPMQLGVLLTALESNKTPIPGEHAAKNLGTVMWRLKDFFVNIPGHGYWPKDQPYPPAGYAPPQTSQLTGTNS